MFTHSAPGWWWSGIGTAKVMFMKTLLKVLLWLLGTLVALVGIVHAEEYLRGRYLWERHLRELAAQGDSLDIRKYIPPPIPDDRNMAAAPIFAELYATNRPANRRLLQVKLPDLKTQERGDWRGAIRVDLNLWKAAFTNDNLLAALVRYEPVLQEVEVAAQRPQARFNVRYENVDDIRAFVMLNLAKVYRVKALAGLAAGHSDAALADVRLMLRLARASDDEPALSSLQERAAIIKLAIQPAWEGLADRRWKADQLDLLQQDLAGINLLKHLELALQGERCSITWKLEQMLKHPDDTMGIIINTDNPPRRQILFYLIPKGWFYINCFNTDRSFQKYILPSLDSRAMRLYPDRAEALDPVMDGYSEHPLRTQYHVMEMWLLAEPSISCFKVAVAQTAAQGAVTACALERYRLAHGRYPDTLAVLVPQHLAAVPNDVIDGQPLRYRREGADGFILYSIGWNMKDDGGQVAWGSKENKWVDDRAGDWVWRSQPAAP